MAWADAGPTPNLSQHFSESLTPPHGEDGIYLGGKRCLLIFTVGAWLPLAKKAASKRVPLAAHRPLFLFAL